MDKYTLNLNKVREFHQVAATLSLDSCTASERNLEATYINNQGRGWGGGGGGGGCVITLGRWVGKHVILIREDRWGIAVTLTQLQGW